MIPESLPVPKQIIVHTEDSIEMGYSREKMAISPYAETSFPNYQETHCENLLHCVTPVAYRKMYSQSSRDSSLTMASLESLNHFGSDSDVCWDYVAEELGNIGEDAVFRKQETLARLAHLSLRQISEICTERPEDPPFVQNVHSFVQEDQVECQFNSKKRSRDFASIIHEDQFRTRRHRFLSSQPPVPRESGTFKCQQEIRFFNGGVEVDGNGGTFKGQQQVRFFNEGAEVGG
jgi:hypothetical protein